jgi:hypothetical protein
MNIDSFFTIGTTHLVCEDYALHGENYVILSDGCSNGGGPRIHTDWGSRILCKAAEQHIDLLPDDRLAFNNRCISTAMTQVASFPKLSNLCLTATLLIAVIKHGKIWIHLVGDGTFGFKFKDGSYGIHDYNFESSAPYYLKYDLSNEDRAEYLEKFGSNVKHTIWTISPSIFTKLEIEESILDKRFFSSECEYDVDDVEFVFIASDGLSSFYKTVINGTNKQNIRIPIPEVCETLLDFKNFGSNFVERQCHWVFKTNRVGSFGRNDILHSDDVSLGVIYCK